VFNPSGVGEVLGKFLLLRCDGGAVGIEEQRAGAGCALVECEDVIGVHGIPHLLPDDAAGAISVAADTLEGQKKARKGVVLTVV